MLASRRVTRWRARLSDLQRLRRVLQVLVRHGFGSIVDQLGINPISGPPSADIASSSRLGRRLARALTDLGPTFVKLGQVLSTRDDLLPDAITAELATLQQQVRPVPVAEIRDAVENALGAPLHQHFAFFATEPLASASIAQVHRARTVDGEEVVVKVRRPGISARVDEDLGLLLAIAVLLEERVEESRRYDPVGVVNRFAEDLRGELDFRAEHEALKRMREVGGAVVVPRPYGALCGESILTMDLIEGPKVTEVRDPELRHELAQQILRSFVRQILQEGFFHADPHPGNLVAHRRVPEEPPSLGLLDFGAVGTLDDGMRADLFRIAAAAAARDGVALADALLAMIEPPGPSDREAYVADVGAFLERLLSRNLRELRFSHISSEVWDLARTHALRIRPAYFQLLRTAVTLDGVVRDLDPALDPLNAARGHILWATVAGGAWRDAWALGQSLAQSEWDQRPLVRRAALVAGGVAVAVVGVVAWLLT